MTACTLSLGYSSLRKFMMHIAIYKLVAFEQPSYRQKMVKVYDTKNSLVH